MQSRDVCETLAILHKKTTESQVWKCHSTITNPKEKTRKQKVWFGFYCQLFANNDAQKRQLF